MEKPVAVVTGANRGIGREVAKELASKGMRVIVTARDEAKGKRAADELSKGGHDVRFQKLDVTSEADIRALRQMIEREMGGRVDVLVNNAGIFVDSDGPESENSGMGARAEVIRRTFETNTLAPFLLSQALLPLMKKRGHGRVVNVSSGMGQLDEMGGGYPAYRISKTALNAVTRIFASEMEGTDVLVNSVCPGWVKTDMGGAGAERPVEKGAETIVWLATLPKGGPTGGFFRDREPIAW